MPNQLLDTFDPQCKDGAKWYACETTSSNPSPFVGCCKADPCTSAGCATGNLSPVSFNASAYGTLPDPACGTSSTFFSCVNMPKNDTTFWGCCKSNACEKVTCRQTDLTPAFLDTPLLQEQYSADGNAAEEEQGGGGKSNTGAIVGGAVGGGVAVIAIIAILVFCLFKRRRAKSRPNTGSAASAIPSPGTEKTDYRHSTVSDGTGLGLNDAATAGSPTLYSGSPKPPPFSPAMSFGAHQYQHVAPGSPQELPGDFTQGATQRYSELPGAAPYSPNGSPQGTQAPAELESPAIGSMSPRPLDTGLVQEKKK